jgi:predicted transcriptional regulator
VLHVLDAPTGVAITRRLSTCYGSDICHAHLSQTLNQLVDAGLVAKGQQDGRTNAYDLTDRGRAALQARDELLQGGPDGQTAHSDDGPTDADLVTDGGETQPAPTPALHHISLDRSAGVRVVIHATSDRAAHDIEQFVKEELYDQFHRVYRERDHNAHLNEADAGFDDCYQVVVETTEDQARDIARHVSERFSTEATDD